MNRLNLLICAFFFSCGTIFSAQAPWIQPYLGQLTENSVEIRWEHIDVKEAYLLYGPTHRFPRSVVKATPLPMHPRTPSGHQLFGVILHGLKPNTEYVYQIKTTHYESKTYRFRTTDPDSGSFGFTIYSDTQRNPEVHAKIADAVLQDGQTQFVLVPGDLVHVGADYDEYRNKFFKPAETLFASVPSYPAVGNHEYQGLEQGEAPIYLNYFSVPSNHSKNYEGHWYSFDHQNVRVLSLNTNFGAQTKFKWHPDMFDAKAASEQLKFLERQLTTFCEQSNLDFVFVFFHHPNVAELWTVGGEEYSQRIVDRINKATSQCDKAGAVFNGHMHGYARGQSKDAPVYWVTAASAGGLLDYWGDYENEDFPNIQKSIPSFGYVQVTVHKDPARFYVKRYKVGDNLKSLHAPVVEDIFEYRSDNLQPKKPVLEFVDGKFIETRYNDPDHDRHLETEWELFDISGRLLKSLWLRFENIYNGKTQTLTTELTRLRLEDSIPEGSQIRVRHRDNALGWSEWSEKLSLQ